MLILMAYLLLSIGKISGQSPAFQWANVFGAAGITINAWWHWALPSVGLNLIWMLIGVFTLARLAQRKARAPASRE